MSVDWTSESEDEVIVKSDDDEIEAPSQPKRVAKRVAMKEPVEEPAEDPLPLPVKRPRGRPRVIKPTKPEGQKRRMSDKQLENLQRGREKRQSNAAAKRALKEADAEEKKKVRDAKIVKKATRIRKKEVLEEAVLELSSEDEMDDLEVKQVKRVVAQRKSTRKKSVRKATPSNAAKKPEPSGFVFV